MESSRITRVEYVACIEAIQSFSWKTGGKRPLGRCSLKPGKIKRERKEIRINLNMLVHRGGKQFRTAVALGRVQDFVCTVLNLHVP
jgi:hypothetical protein